MHALLDRLFSLIFLKYYGFFFLSLSYNHVLNTSNELFVVIRTLFHVSYVTCDREFSGRVNIKVKLIKQLSRLQCSVSGYAGSLIALCDVFNSIGNILNIVISRILFTDTADWTVSFMVSIAFPIACSVLFILFASSKNQCWDQRYIRPMT